MSSNILQKKIQRVEGKKNRLWLIAFLPFGTGATPPVRLQLTQQGQPYSAYLGNISNGKVPYPLELTEARCHILPGADINPANAYGVTQIVATSFIEIVRADQVKVFEFAMADSIEMNIPVIGTTSTSFTMNTTSRPRKLEGNKQRFLQGDICDVYLNLGAHVPWAQGVQIGVELSGYSI